MKKLIELLKEHKAQAPHNSWNELNNRLEHRKNRNTLARYRLLSIAAIFIALISCMVVMSLYVKKYNPQKFASSKEFTPIILESLTISMDEIYKIDNIHSLYADYQKLQR